MRQVSTLYILLGFAGDVDRPLSELRKRYATENNHFISRTYPDNIYKRHDYLFKVGEKIIDFIFGQEGQTGFCRRQDRPCELVAGKGKRACNKADAACVRSRPSLLVAIVHPDIWDETFRRFGRCMLLVLHKARDLTDVDLVSKTIDDSKEKLASIKQFLNNLPFKMLAPLVPLENFQVKSGNYIASEAQADLSLFTSSMEAYHDLLYRSDFTNPIKKKQRGAYMFNDDVGFQRDLLHSFAHLGAESRANVYHLINAYHVYGVPTLAGLHFDVVSEDDGALKVRFQDIVTSAESSEADKHVNLSPCGRIV